MSFVISNSLQFVSNLLRIGRLWFHFDRVKNMLFPFQPMMDRNKAEDLPKMQCGFIDFVCAFVYKVRSSIWMRKQNEHMGLH